MSPPQGVPIPLAGLLGGYRIVRTLWLASYLVLVYDWLLTLDDEVSCIWGWPLTRRQVLYFINRYWPLINLFPMVVGLLIENPDPQLCQFQYAWFTFANIVTQVTTTTILILRIYAMYGRSKRLLWSLLFLQGLTFASQGILTTVMAAKLKLEPISKATGCLPGGWDLHPWVYDVPAIVLDTSLFGILAFKTAQHYLRDENHNMLRISTTFSTLLLDNTIYFVAAVLIIAINFIAYFVGGPLFYVALPQTLPISYSIIGCRMLINVKKATSPQHAEPWRNTETAIFSHVIRPLSFLQSNLGSPTLAEPLSPSPSYPPGENVYGDDERALNLNSGSLGDIVEELRISSSSV